MTGPSYEYRAIVRRVVDGDTLDLAIDLGFECTLVTRVRLLGVNTPEVVGATKVAGKAAAAFAEAWAHATNGEVLIRSYKAHEREKYGRWLVEVYPTRTGLTKSLNTELLESGNAVLMTDKGGAA